VDIINELLAAVSIEYIYTQYLC